MSSDSESEDFVIYGTPLEPLEEDTIPKKRAVTVEDQVAKDKYGRRRFHGAFTGGFSAGFFNTVGSLEGWKPSQFKSSRQVKAQSQVQKAEDYMDDEDMDEFGIAPKMLRPTGDYDRSNEGPSRKRPQTQFSDGPIPGIPVLKTLEPVRETIGIKLLMKMGWKPGHGIGPRLSKKEKSSSKKLRAVKTYGCSLPNQEDKPIQYEETSDESEDEEFYKNVTFAPDDFEPFLVKPKTDCFGLGYSGLDRRPVLSAHINLFEPVRPSLVMQEKKKKVSIRGQGFGVGALEKDDEDVYSTEDMSQYDFALDTPKMMAEKRQKERQARSTRPSSSTSDVLEGFLLSLTPVVRKTYPPPTLPAGFVPQHRCRQSRFSASAATDTGRVTALTANERAVMVNEPTSSKPQSQVQENIKPITVERTTSGTFQPFVSDPDKQERYEKYLTLSKLGQTDKLKTLQPLRMTEWERERERAEFAQAERLYRPLSAAFSERFVSASQADSATDPLAPVARTQSADQDLCSAAKLKMFGKLTRRVGEWQPHSVLCKRFNIPQPGCSNISSQSKSSRPKFSVFNFLDAAPFNTPAQPMDVNEPYERTETNIAESESSITPSTSGSTGLEVVEKNEMDDTSNVDDKLEQLVDSTNKMDLYKAIFLSSSDEDEEDDDKTPGPSKPPQKPEQPTAKELNILRNTSPPRGIFANLDLDKLNSLNSDSRQKPQDEIRNEVSSSEKSPPRGIFANLDMTSKQNRNNNSNKIETTDEAIRDYSNSTIETKEPDNCHMYGPTLPKSLPQPSLRVESIKEESSASEEDWVEMNSGSDSETSNKQYTKKKHSKKSHKKSKKHKVKKHKHKKKRK